MSYSFEGKIVNQPANIRISGAKCSKCNKLVSAPKMTVVKDEEKRFQVLHYIGDREFIYESKSGRAVIYCSEYCKNKHNHRFNK